MSLQKTPHRMIGIRIDRIVKRFGSVTALDGVDFQIEPGELFFLLGPSGCGKTTLLRTLAGFYAPDSGHLFFGDKDVTNLPAHRRQAGMVFQSYALWPHMTVAENVAFGLKQKKLPKSIVEERLQEALTGVRMEQFSSRKPNELSGGQQQRVALARALAVRPRCLLLDEPLSNLDAQLRNEMRLEIRRICREHRLTTIYVTHDQKEALSIADRMAVFSKGRIEQIGTPLEVYKLPRNRFVANFVGETNFLEGKVLRWDGPFVAAETILGTVLGTPVDPSNPPAIGDCVHLSLRPEVIRLRSEAIDSNCFSGDIVSMTYFGEVAHYDFYGNGIRLKVSELNPRHLGHNGDATIFANVRPEDVIVLMN
ncbi:MAG: ABC transporter ATP-binding protein [Puniceicoccales bacterium]|jgi:iron(III) transport system ATP-binding protein|nr:ABC transporter ATP-binding protein [Puniceicoccales bacterium]